MTQIGTEEGKSYLATVEDHISHRLLGSAMSERHNAVLAVASLQMAVVTRGGDVDGVIFHSDRAEALLKIAAWVADFSNIKRRHSGNDGLLPVAFKHQMIEKRQASTALLTAAVAYDRLHTPRGLTA